MAEVKLKTKEVINVAESFEDVEAQLKSKYKFLELTSVFLDLNYQAIEKKIIIHVNNVLYVEGL